MIVAWLQAADEGVRLFGVRLVGFTAETLHKGLLSAAFVVVALGLSGAVRTLLRRVTHDERNVRVRFWTQQAVQIVTTLVLVAALVSIWFDDPARFAGVAGLVTAGLAVALQRVVTAVAAYVIILRGKTFHIGDRIVMGDVRGDVIDLGYIRTTIMEMGQPPGAQGDAPDVWVQARQYTGRIVTVTNDKIFDAPVYNYSTDLSMIWDELHLPIAYQADRKRAERILLDAAERHTLKYAELAREELATLRRRFMGLRAEDFTPRVYYRLTDNWLELTLRFAARPSGVRVLKDAMSRDILDALDAAGIGVASATFEVVGLPPLRLQAEGPVPVQVEGPDADPSTPSGGGRGPAGGGS